MLMHNSWEVIKVMYTADVKLNSSMGRYDACMDDMQYTLCGVDYRDNHKKRSEILLSELVELLDNHKIVIENLEYIEDDIKIFKGRLDSSLQKQYDEYTKFRAKCDLLGITCTDIRHEKNRYVLYNLVPDENGVATIPDFVTVISQEFHNNSKQTKYRKIIWKNPLVFSIKDLFQFNNRIVNIDLSEFNLSVIPDIHRLFFACRTLETVDFGDNDFHNVTNISELFKNTSRLIEADLSKAKPRRTYLMNNIALGDSELTSLKIPELSHKTDKLRFGIYYKLLSGIIDEKTGSNTKFTEIIMKATSLAHILTWMDEYSMSISNRVVAVYLDEFTGINYIKDTIPEDIADGLDIIKLRSMMTSYEDDDFTKSEYKQYINKDILLRFARAGYSDGSGKSQHFGRLAIECKLDAATKERLNSIDSKGYKNRLLIAGYRDDKAIYMVYFNNYSDWE